MDRRIQQVTTLIHDEFTRPLILQELARSVNLSPSHFRRLFRAETGQTPARYLKERRMEKAKELAELVTNADRLPAADVSRRAAQVLLTGGELGRPVLATPGIPADRVNLLRGAYMKAMKDPELLAEAQKGKMDVDPSPGEELEDLVKKVMEQPKEVMDRVKKMLEN
jgi:AraC-like DNA-binding protein